MGEKSVGEKYMVDRSVGEKYMSEKYMCGRLWVKSLWVKNGWGKIGVDGMLAFVPPSQVYWYASDFETCSSKERIRPRFPDGSDVAPWLQVSLTKQNIHICIHLEFGITGQHHSKYSSIIQPNKTNSLILCSCQEVYRGVKLGWFPGVRGSASISEDFFSRSSTPSALLMPQMG
jgi:hypothetical protein